MTDFVDAGFGGRVTFSLGGDYSLEDLAARAGAAAPFVVVQAVADETPEAKAAREEEERQWARDWLEGACRDPHEPNVELSFDVNWDV